MADNRRVKRKAKKQKMRKGCFASLISFVLIVTAVLVMFLTPVFDVAKVSVTGNKRVTPEVIKSVSGIKVGDNIFSVNSSKARKKIRALQYIEDAKIVKQYPNKIKIEITEGKISAYIQHGEKVVGINSHGMVLCNISLVGVKAGAPVVKGFTVTKNAMGETVLVKEKKKFDSLLKFMDTFTQMEMVEKITAFDISDDDYIVFRYEDKLEVQFGNMKDYENKFDYLKAILDYWTDVPEGVLNMTSENYTFRNVVTKKSE